MTDEQAQAWLKRFDLTYEELKQAPDRLFPGRYMRFDLTYEELKQLFMRDKFVLCTRVLILPMRN